MLVDVPETSIQTGAGKRWDGQRMELQVSMWLWKFRPANIYRKTKKEKKRQAGDTAEEER